MSLLLLVAGALFAYAGITGKTKEFNVLLRDSFGFGQFWAFAIAVVILGSLGKSQSLRPVSDGLLGLVILVLILSNKGFFGKLEEVAKSLGGTRGVGL